MTKTEKANIRALTKGLHTALSWWTMHSYDKPFGKRETRAVDGVVKLIKDAEALLKR